MKPQHSSLRILPSDLKVLSIDDPDGVWIIRKTHFERINEPRLVIFYPTTPEPYWAVCLEGHGVSEVIEDTTSFPEAVNVATGYIESINNPINYDNE